ncbi:MAG: hypothetical protein ACFFCS_17565 [Candidatus Hodarchaeota archaeon]
MSNKPKGKIIVDITENVSCVLDDQNNVKSVEGKGSLKVINPSEGHRLWNLKVKNDKVNEVVVAKLQTELTKDTLEPTRTWETLYDIENLKEPILKLTEIIDTSQVNEGINYNFVKSTADEASIEITLENTSSKDIQNIKLHKHIPEYLKEVAVKRCSEGSTDINMESKELTWEIGSLPAGEMGVIRLSGRVEIKNSELKSGNVIDVTYDSDMAQRSAVIPSIEALTDTMTGIDQEEDDNKPGWWNCIVEFENESDFEVTVKSLNVSQKIATGEESLVDIQPKAIVGPQNTWTHALSVESPSIPALSQKLDFTANYIVPTRIIGKIHQEAKTFKVLETSIAKDINPPTVNANANTDMVITNTITNLGTANVDKISYKDIIPKDFEPPTIDGVKCEIVDFAGVQVATLTVDNALVTINPPGKDSTVPHTINIDFKNLDEMLGPNNKLVVKYPIIARNPQPNVTYETPVEIKSDTKPSGVGYKDTTADVPVIGIKYVKRKVKTAKSISPAGANAFNVIVKISNKGGVEIEKVTIVEKIPPGFKAGSFEPEDIKPAFEEVGEGGKLTWAIARLDPGVDLKLKYIAEGSGEFPRTEPQVIVAEPDSLKKEETPAVQAAPRQDIITDASDKYINVGKVISAFKNKISQIITYEEVSNLVSQLRDDLFELGAPAMLMREFTKEIEDLKIYGTKKLIGDALDEMLDKAEKWKERVIG